MILKTTAKRRKRKAEIEAEISRKQEEEKERKEFEDVKIILKGKNMKTADIPQILHQNENLVGFMQSRGIIDETGQIKP